MHKLPQTPDEIETYRYQCEVRQLLEWRSQRGKQWLREFLANPQIDEKRRGRLINDIWYQWQMGNRGEKDVWFE